MAGQPIADEEIILRHIPGGTTFQAPGPRITSKNFELRFQETGISVSRQSITSAEQLLKNLGNAATGSRIAAVSVAAIRLLGLDVVPDPTADDAGHAELRSPTDVGFSLSIRKQLATAFVLLAERPSGN